MDLKFFTYKTNASRPRFTRHYPIPYDRIVGIESLGRRLWTPENDGYAQNKYNPQDTTEKRLRLPQKLGERIMQYFEDYFLAPPDIDHPRRNCHHFAQRMIDPSAPEYAGTQADNDPANSAAQRIVREGVPIGTGEILAMGAVGVFGCVNEKSEQRIGYHSIVGMGVHTPIQVFGVEGNIGFYSIADSQKRTEYLDQLPDTKLYVEKSR